VGVRNRRSRVSYADLVILMPIDHLLVIAFGGPPRPEDVKPFLERVSQGRRIPPERLAEVAHHYEVTGGFSPYNAHTEQLVEALRVRLREASITLPLAVGMRNWHPFLAQTLRDLSAQGLTHGLGIILAPHRCESSFGQYLKNVEEAKIEASAPQMRYEYLAPWHDHPRFIEAQADHLRRALDRVPASERQTAWLIFTAHSIPVEMAQRNHYVEEFETSSRLVANAVGWTRWHCGYQSRSGSPHQPWLTPDVAAVLQVVRAQGARHAIIVPIGFLSDHTEVLYDLDLEARQEAERLGLVYHRASTVMDHPAFVDMFVQLIRAHLSTALQHTDSEGDARPRQFAGPAAARPHPSSPRRTLPAPSAPAGGDPSSASPAN